MQLNTTFRDASQFFFRNTPLTKIAAPDAMSDAVETMTDVVGGHGSPFSLAISFPTPPVDGSASGATGSFRLVLEATKDGKTWEETGVATPLITIAMARNMANPMYLPMPKSTYGAFLFRMKMKDNTLTFTDGTVNAFLTTSQSTKELGSPHIPTKANTQTTS